MGACIARKALVSDTRNRVGYWISGWGAADAQEVIRNSSGGVDFIGNYQKGIRCGIVNVLGHLIDNDRFCEDAFKRFAGCLAFGFKSLAQETVDAGSLIEPGCRAALVGNRENPHNATAGGDVQLRARRDD